LEAEDVKVQTATSLKKNDFMVGSLGSGQTSRDIIKWAFESDTDPGMVSPALYTYTDDANYVDSKHVIVGLKSIDKAGLATVESVKSKIEKLVKDEKKAEKIKAKINSTDLNFVAGIFSLPVEKAENVTFGSAAIPLAGLEPILTGKVFKLNPSEVTAPVTGNAGVYVAKLISKTPASTEGGAFGQKMQLTQQSRMSVDYKLMETLKKSAKIKDNRFTFF
jgi:peptidyl-prolyl cis-trans isomerase D